MEIDKILSVTLIILAIPVTISVVVLLARLLKVIFFHGEVNLEDVIFSKERIRQVDKSNMEQERNIVSIQEAVAISNYKSQRELMMNILRKDTSQSLGSISYALNSEDTETSHYAATALRDELGDFRSNVLKLYKNVKKVRKLSHRSSASSLKNIWNDLSGCVSAYRKKQYTGMIDEIMKIMLADYKDDIKPQYYEWIVRCMIEMIIKRVQKSGVNWQKKSSRTAYAIQVLSQILLLL